MEPTDLILILSVCAGFFMAFSLGANDVSNSMASPVASKALSLRQALFLGAILNCVGSIFLGSHVTTTIATGIIDPNAVPDKFLFMLGMFSVLLAAGLWVLIASFASLPVSSTHSIVGSIIGLGLVLGGPEVVNWKSLLTIMLAWMLSPLTGALVSFITFSHIKRYILFARQMLRGAVRWIPLWLGLTLALILLSFLYKTPLGKSFDLAWWQGCLIGVAALLVVMLICRKMLPRIINFRGKPTEQVEDMFKRMQVCTACYVALSQGANDVSNAIGPVAAIYMVARSSGLTGQVEIPLWLLVMGGAGIALGIFCLGHKVMGTLGERITNINNSRGFAVDFSSATTVLIATNLGMPVSSTHAAVGAVVGVGLARGWAAVDFRVLGKIVLYWILTVPIAGFTCIVIYTLLRYILVS
ncbi:MAG: inorganic phosphate transporter [Deltaproteobacteria bacterium]|jgi:PiT family inorganic phosphate transporter|nr:inorganic phosphate transporter [Deltaproteobacteria bacterium]